MLPRSSLSSFKNVDSVRILCPVLLQIVRDLSSRWNVQRVLALDWGNPSSMGTSEVVYLRFTDIPLADGVISLGQT